MVVNQAASSSCDFSSVYTWPEQVFGIFCIFFYLFFGPHHLHAIKANERQPMATERQPRGNNIINPLKTCVITQFHVQFHAPATTRNRSACHTSSICDGHGLHLAPLCCLPHNQVAWPGHRWPQFCNQPAVHFIKTLQKSTAIQKAAVKGLSCPSQVRSLLPTR